jgi:hypothetical protein
MSRQDLGDFEGLPVVAQSLVLKGTGDGLSKAMAVKPVHIGKGDTVDLLIRARAGSVKFDPHKDDPDAWVRVETLTAETITIVDREFAQASIEQQEAANDRALGRTKIPFPPAVDKGALVVTDENGVVLTPAEIAERRGDGRPVVETGPAVVVYDDGSRALWPDEFDRDVLRPTIGEDDVADLLDPTTGESFGLAGDVGEGGSTDATATDDDGSLSPAEVAALDEMTIPLEDDDWEDVPAVDNLPTSVDFEVLAGTVKQITADVEACTDIGRLLRLLRGERQGAGSASKPRASLITAIEARIVEVGGVL